MPFRDLAGHARTLSLLSRAAAGGTLPPSLIFAGIEGIGKRSAAVALAQVLNCPSPRREESRPDGHVLALDACGACPSCSRLARNVHPDLLVVEPDPETGNIRIEEVRAVTDRLGYRPFEARWRAVIIDAAEALMEAAQHALLKTLEEPPSSTVFMLITSQPDALLPTVRSRCPRIRFAPLTVAEVAGVLQTGHGMPPAQAQALAAVSGGSIGAALQTGSASLAEARASAERLLVHLARRTDPHARLAAAREIVGKTAKGYGASERESLAVHLKAVHALLRDVGALSSSADPAALANVDLEAALARIAPSFDGRRIADAFAAIDQGLAALDKRNASPKIVADWVVMRI